MQAGDRVTVGPPFDAAFPGEYIVEGVDETGACLIDGGRGFAEQFLVLVEAGNGAPPPTVSKRITKYALRTRFTQPEKVAVEFAALDDPAASVQARQFAAALRAYLRDFEVAQFVDLALPETIAGIQSLEAAGLLAAGRADEILNTPIEAHEAA